MVVVFSALTMSIAYGSQLTLHESIRGEVLDIALSNSAELAAASYQQACVSWEKRVRETVKQGLVYLSCGSRKDATVRTWYEGTEVIENIAYPHTYYRDPFGRVSSSVGTIVIDTPEDQSAIEESIDFATAQCEVDRTGSCLSAVNEAYRDFLGRCQEFRRNAEANLGNRLVYANCNQSTADGLDIGSKEFKFTFSSKGQVFYSR